ncbi:NADP-dependent oxidoreductase domain-containing protein [Mycena vulgaris]|nr:NADP-dependent oxidoreductase domain-containing protein [Mycena vulgaris]
MHAACSYDAGISTFVTVDRYSNGMSEVLPCEEIVVMTKVYACVGKTVDVNALALLRVGPDNMGYVNQHGLSRKHIFAMVKDSLKRLQLEYIDGLQWDPHYAITHNLTPFISMTNQYSLVYREEEREMMPSLKVPFSPHLRVEGLAKKRNVSMAQIALALLMAKDGFTAPIVGTSSLANLVDLFGAVDVKLTEEEIKHSEEPYKPMNIFILQSCRPMPPRGIARQRAHLETPFEHVDPPPVR